MSKMIYMYNDWVMVGNVPYQVQLWTKKKIGYNKIPTKISYARLCDVEPIPVTEEFLFKNGFVLQDVFLGYKQYTNVNDKITISFNGLYFYVNEKGNIIQLKYVHQIQHMYEWKQIDKTWIL